MKKIGIFSNNWHFNVFYALLLLGAASLPFTSALMLPIAITLGLNWIIEWNWKEKWTHFKENKATVPFIFFIALYACLILGFINTANMPKAWEGFECKLWFLIAPLMLLTASPTYLNKDRICKLLSIFVTSTLINICVIICIAAFKMIMIGHSYYFYYIHLSILGHPSYVSMYATISLFIVLDYVNKYRKNLSLEYRLSLYFVLLIFATAIIILRSKAGMLTFGITFLIWFFYLFNLRKRRIGWSITFISIFIGFGIISATTDLLPMNRFKESLDEIQERKEIPYGTGSSQVRMTVWKSAWEIIQKNQPFGVGTGDGLDELNLHAVQKKYSNLIRHHYNCHNQYLQGLLTNGIPGLLTLLMFCFYPIVVSIQKKDMLYLTFALVIIFNMLVESMLETRAGVDFITFMNILLFLLANKKETKADPLS